MGYNFVGLWSIHNQRACCLFFHRAVPHNPLFCPSFDESDAQTDLQKQD